MDPAGAVWQNELSQKILNHTPSQEKGEGPAITRYLPQESVPLLQVFQSKQLCLLQEGPVWWTQTATQNNYCFCKVLGGDHTFPVAPACLGLMCSSSPRWRAGTFLHKQWLIAEVKIARVIHSYVWIWLCHTHLWPWASYSTYLSFGFLIDETNSDAHL